MMNKNLIYRTPLNFRTVVSFFSPKKSFWKKSYIPYTSAPNILYLQVVSGVE